MNNYSDYEKTKKYGIFSPRFEGIYQRPKLNEQNIFGNYNSYSKFSKTGRHNNPINIYYSPKNNEKPSKIPKILSPLHRKLNKLYRSSSQQNIKSRRINSNSREFPSLESFSFRKLKFKKSRNKNDKKIKYNYFNIEKEKLYQETNQIRKVAKILTKNLLNLKHENLMKDKQINIKQKKINDFILSNNDSLFETNIYLNNNIRDNNNNNNNNNNDINNVLKDSNVNNNNNSQYDIGSNNSSINNNNINISIYSNPANNNNNNNINSPTGNLYNKIKKEIKQMNTEIKTEKEKYEKIKKSLYLTKMNELSFESALLEEQIKKINSFITKAFEIQEENLKKRQEFINLRENIEKQENIIKNMTERAKILDKEEVRMTKELEKGKKNLVLKGQKIKINKKRLKILKERNNNLFKNINDINQPYVVKNDHNHVEIKSYFTGKISQLNKLINFFNHQNKYYVQEMNKLKDRHQKLVNEEKKKDGKFEKKEPDVFSSKSIVSDNEKLEHLRGMYKEKVAEAKELEKKLILYQNKLKEIENPDGDMGDGNQIEFGIDGENPYYTDNNENSPEVSNKFTSWQFNQFTYILFKNFESKGISYEESKTKVINPFIDFNNKNNFSNIVYPSNEFDLIVEGYTKIIMEVLNFTNNNYNYTLTKIFVSALFFNSECDVNKLIEYFNILFSYTINYSLEEEKYINKLQTKYQEQTKKLISCIKDNIPNGPNAKREKYIHLLRMKELLEHNDINLKDKYIEFIFYYMKKFEDQEAKLGDLKYSLLNDIIPGEFEYSFKNEDKNKDNDNDNNNNNDNNEISIKEKEDINLDNLNKGKEKEKEKEKLKGDKNKKRKIDEEIDFDNLNENENINDNEFERKEIKSVTEDNLSQKHNKNKIDKNDKENSDDMEEDEDSMTEITNEEYVKQLTEAITLIEKGIKEANTNFTDLMVNVVQKRKITGNYYECITIEDFNDQLKSINVILSDLKLSCLCSKYSIPNELRLIDKNKIEKDIQDFIKGALKLDDEENNI